MGNYTTQLREHLYLLDRGEAYLPFDNPSFHNPEFRAASFRLLILRLSPFRDVDRSLPHLFLFQEARRALPEAYIDVAFFPSRAERALFDSLDMPYLIGAQSMRSLSEFDLVLVSNAYTLELINLPYLLERSGIPLYSSQRGPEWPILILGGSNARATQALIRPSGDSLVDGIFFGEGEDRVADLVSTLVQRSEPKEARLRAAATGIQGFWAAGALIPVDKAVACAPQATALPVSYPLLNSPEVHTASLPITFGCPAFCAFCFEGYDRKPYREMPLSDLLDSARRIKRAQGNEELNLYSFNFNTHSDILQLLLDLHKLFERVSFMSQRVDILQHGGTLLQAEVEAGKQHYTLGIEGISARQRAWLHKSLPTEDILALLERLLAMRVREVKLFYVLTGHETKEDIAEFRGFVRQAKEMRRMGNQGLRVVFSAGLLIRMPSTPLRYDRLFLDADHWRPLIGQVKSACETNGFEFRMAFDWAVYCTTQVLALGGYWLADPIVDLAREGFFFDTELPAAYWDRLQQWMIDHGQWNEKFLSEKGAHDVFALDFVRGDISSEFLYDQFLQSRAGKDAGYCLGSHDSTGRCLDCGSCASPEQRAAITRHALRLPDAAPYLSQMRTVVARKRRLQPIYLHVRLPAWVGSVNAQYANALLFQQILARCPDQVENLLSVRESLFTLRSNQRYPLMSGETVFALKAWDVDALADCLSDLARTPPPLGERECVILGQAMDFSPGEFRRLNLHLTLPGSLFPEARRVLDQYLRQAYVPYSLRRRGDPEAGYQFDMPKKGLKKKVLLGGEFVETNHSFVARLEVGPKFDLLSYLGLFGSPGLYCQARLSVSDLAWR